jgi:hypothetical protein
MVQNFRLAADGLKKGNLAAKTVPERLPELAQDLSNFLCVHNRNHPTSQ